MSSLSHSEIEQIANRGDALQQVRRRIMAWTSIGIIGYIATLVGVPIIGFIVAPLLRAPKYQWRAVGPLNSFEIGKTVLVKFQNYDALAWGGMVSNTAAWLRRTGPTAFSAFSINCTHLGCPVRWEPEAQLFFCPCHGGVYYADGTVASAPPPRRLSQYPVRVNQGQVEVLSVPIPLPGRHL
jgi:menaquinol-cytochrome c reductase iron-sulfur subunit